MRVIWLPRSARDAAPSFMVGRVVDVSPVEVRRMYRNMRRTCSPVTARCGLLADLNARRSVEWRRVGRMA